MAGMTVPRDPEAWARLGKRIREYREKAGYSRRALAEKAGVSEKSIQVAEEGRVPRGRMPQSLNRIEVALEWLPGTWISILNGSSSIVTVERQEVDVQLEPEGAYTTPVVPTTPAAPSAPLNARDVELTQSGHLAQDIFMRQARRYRKLREMTLDDLAEKAQMLGSTLSGDDLKRLEDGTRLLRMNEAQTLAQALDTSVDWLLGSGFSDDSPEEMRWPPDAEELQAEANAVLRRLGDMGGQVFAAQQQHARARVREEEARRQAEMAMSMLHSAMAQEQEMHRHYQYLLGRIDSIRAARGESTTVQFEPVYDGELSSEGVAPGSVAAKLREARLQASLTQNDLQARTQISAHRIAALERGDWGGASPGSANVDVFVRGCIRRIAHALNLDPSPLVAQYEVERGI